MLAKLALIAVGLVCSLFHIADAQAASFCISPYVRINDHCYSFHQQMVTWHTAEMTCAREGGELASVLTNAQYNGILTHLNENYAGTYWLSGAPRKGRWVWTTNNTPMSPTWWGGNRVPPADPNNCAYFCSHTLRYWSKNCAGRLRFICQKSVMTIVTPSPELTEPEVFPTIPAQ